MNGDKIVCGEHAEAIENVLEHPYEGSMLHKTLHRSARSPPSTPYVLKDLGKPYNYQMTKDRIDNASERPAVAGSKTFIAGSGTLFQLTKWT